MLGVGMIMCLSVKIPMKYICSFLHNGYTIKLTLKFTQYSSMGMDEETEHLISKRALKYRELSF